MVEVTVLSQGPAERPCLILVCLPKGQNWWAETLAAKPATLLARSRWMLSQHTKRSLNDRVYASALVTTQFCVGADKQLIMARTGGGKRWLVVSVQPSCH